MKEFKVKGLSSANCARELEEQVQKLEHGEGATINFNSSKLRVKASVDLNKVEKILASDGAMLVKGKEALMGIIIVTIMIIVTVMTIATAMKTI